MINKDSIAWCMDCGYTGRVLFLHDGYKWWMIPLALLFGCTGVGIIVVAVVLILLGNHTRPVCPNCKGPRLVPWSEPPSAENDAIWQRATAEDAAEFGRNKNIVLSIVLALFALAVILAALVMLQ